MNNNWLRRKNIYLPLLILITGIIVGGTTISANINPITTTTKVVVEEKDQLVTMESGISIPLSIDDILDFGDAIDTIVIGKVKTILPAKKTQNLITPIKEDTIIYQDVIIEINRYLYGGSGNNNIAVQVNGGRVGNEVWISENEPSFKLDEECLLVLAHSQSYQLTPIPEGIDAKDYYKVIASKMGKYSIEGNEIVDYNGIKYPISSIEESVNSVFFNN